MKEWYVGIYEDCGENSVWKDGLRQIGTDFVTAPSRKEAKRKALTRFRSKTLVAKASPVPSYNA